MPGIPGIPPGAPGIPGMPPNCACAGPNETSASTTACGRTRLSAMNFPRAGDSIIADAAAQILTAF
jgi:hypothetical protein